MVRRPLLDLSVLLIVPLLGACFADSSTSETSDATSDSTSEGTTSGTTTASTTSTSTAGTTTTSSTTGPTTDTASATGSTTDTATGSTTDATGSTTDATGSTTGAVCAGSCVPGIPQGWDGPLAVWNGVALDVPPSCGGDYPTDGFDKKGDFQPGNASCECACGDATGVTCGPSTLAKHAGFQCNTFMPTTYNVAEGDCDFINSGASYWRASVPTASGGSCTSSSNHMLPTPAFDTQTVGCEGTASTEGCAGDELCAPAIGAAFDQLCISSAGDVQCPAGWPAKSLRYDDYSDTRACSACSCGSAAAECTGSVTLQNQGCGVIFVAALSFGSCTNAAAASHASLNATGGGTCPAQGGTLSGMAAPTGVTTVCCQQ